MQRVNVAAVHRAARGDQRLPGHLAAEDPLAVLLRAAAAEDVHLELLQVEERDQPVERGGHGQLFFFRAAAFSRMKARSSSTMSRSFSHCSW